jgi:hypothetical protein
MTSIRWVPVFLVLVALAGPASAQDRRANFQSLFPGASPLDALEIPPGIELFDTAGMQRPRKILCEFASTPIPVRRAQDSFGATGPDEFTEVTSGPSTGELIAGAIGLAVDGDRHSIGGFLKVRSLGETLVKPIRVPSDIRFALWKVTPHSEGRQNVQADVDENPIDPHLAYSRRYLLKLDEANGVGLFIYSLRDRPTFFRRKEIGTFAIKLRVSRLP